MQRPLPKYQHIDHTADVGVQIFAVSLSELFENAGYALFDIIADLGKVHSVIERKVQVEATDLEALLVNWLSELNYLFLTEKELYKEFRIVKIGDTALTATIFGEKLNLDQHEIYTEVKAVTYHHLYVKETKRGWQAQVIFDL